MPQSRFSGRVLNLSATHSNGFEAHGAQGAHGGPKSEVMGAAQKMEPPQEIALFGKHAPLEPPWAPENGAPWAPWAHLGPKSDAMGANNFENLPDNNIFGSLPAT